MSKLISKKSYILQGIVLVLLVVTDQLTKVWARNELRYNPVDVIKGVFVFRYLENRGSIWGILQGKINFLLIVSLLLFFILLYVYIKLPKTNEYKLLLWVDMIMIAGALGNTIDRIFMGYVTDFIYVEIIDFPIFNFADCCITVTAFLTIILLLTKYKDEEFKCLVPNFISKKKTKEETSDHGESNTDN